MFIRSICRKLTMVMAGAFMLTVGVWAHPQSVTYTASVSNVATNFTQTLQLQKFDPLQHPDGTVLYGVRLSYGEEVTDAGSLSTGALPLTYAFTGTSTLTNVALDINQSASIAETGTLAADGSATINDSQSETGGLVNGFLPDYQSSSLQYIDFTLTGTGTSSLSGGSNITDSVGTTAGGFATVTYYYIVMPEASSFLGLVCLLGIGGLQLRRMIRK